MSTLTIDNIDIEVKYSSKRKTISLQVKQGKVRVLVPSFVSEADLSRFVLSKSAWVEEKLAMQNQPVSSHPVFLLHEHGALPFMGTPYISQFVGTQQGEITLQDDGYFLPLSIDDYRANPIKAANLFNQFYCQQAERYLPERVAYWADYTGFSPSKLVIKKYKARWGSCNSLGVLSLNYFLMMAPCDVIDYVIIHELCHLKHLNHSPAFWQLVSQFYSDVSGAKQWLRQHGSLLDWQRLT